MRKPDCRACREKHSAEFAKSTFGRCNDCRPMQKYQTQLASRRKFAQGETITTLDELLQQEWVVAHGRGKHIKAIKNMQLEIVLHWIEHGYFHKAIRKEDVT